ncbi:precorrin-3B C(17)-methyltransferase [Pendulispora albinea]|uniref:Precorrin-3B C(17)-methyltransferase n=1 Tax=Pendulispora albinea TaxID=2741071 RepID=A0ABZ2LX31_9BACT
MSRVGRLAGAILAESRGEYFLVGNTKAPCDWAAAGFERPVEIDPAKRPFVRLAPVGPIAPTALGAPCLTFDLEGEELARTLAARLLIERNGSVSERLWRLVVHRGDPDAEEDVEDMIDARWLGEMPAPIWRIVRDTVLRCL